MDTRTLLFVGVLVLVAVGAGAYFLTQDEVDNDNDVDIEVPETSTEYSAEMSEEGQTITVSDQDGEVAFEYTISDWQEWADTELEDQIAGPVMIGDMEMTPERFERFSTVAVSPDGDRAAFAVFTYAILTTVSLVGVIDLDTQEVTMVEEPAQGEISEFVWSPTGMYGAYTLSTARSVGDYLRVDDMTSLVMTETISEEDITESLQAMDRAPAEPQFPEFDDISWDESGRVVEFTVAVLEDVRVAGTFDVAIGALNIEEPPEN